MAAARHGSDVITTVVPDVGQHVGIGRPVALIAVLRLVLDRWATSPAPPAALLIATTTGRSRVRIER